MANDKKIRNIRLKSLDDVPTILQRLANYTLQEKITTAQMNSLLSCIRTYMDYCRMTDMEADMEEIKDMLQELKDEGLMR